MKIPGALFLTLLSLGLAGCQVPLSEGRGSGSLTIQLPTGQSYRGASAGSTYRIGLVRNNSQVALPGAGSQGYLSVSGNILTIDNLAPGAGYVLQVANGDPDVNGFFVGAYYLESNSFSIQAGSVTPVTVVLSPAPYSVLEDVPGSLHIASDIYTPASYLWFTEGPDVLYLTDIIAPVPANAQTQFSGYLAALSPATTVYSLNATGPYGYWFATDKGVVEAASGLGAPAMAGLTAPFPAVTRTGYVYLTGDVTLSYYFGSGAVAGFALNTEITSGIPTWNPISGKLTGTAATALAAAGAQNKPAVLGLDYLYNGNYLYLSTAFGVYSLQASLLASGTSSTLYSLLSSGVDSNGNSITIQVADPSASVGQVSLYATTTGTAYGFAATDKGLFGGVVSSTTGLPTGPLSLVSGTSGLAIGALATAKVNNSWSNPSPPTVPTVYTAAFSPTTNELLILNNLNVVARIPEFAGLPSGSPRLTWYTSTVSSLTTLYLVITGSDATVLYPVDSWTYQSLG